MGSLGSQTVAPPPPQVINTATLPQTTPAVSTPTVDKPTAEEQAAETRRTTLLQRDRSRFGTILTGFRGLLSTNTNNTERKTLLGE